MRKINVVIAVFVIGSLWVTSAQAQDTNAPLTNIEIFEYQTGTVIVRGSILVGTVPTQIGTVSVRAKESVEPGSGRKEYGIAVMLAENGRHDDTTVIDYDEVDSFLGGIDTISKANHSMTPLPDYDVGYVWHHVEDGSTMQLVEQDIHNAVRHTGGAAVIRNGGFDP